MSDVENGQVEEAPEGVGSMFARDDAGRFAPKESQPEAPVAEVEAPAETTPAPVAVEAPKPVEPAPSVPLATFLEVQNRLKEAERSKRQEPQQYTPPPAPSFYDDPDAYAAHLEQTVQDRLLGSRIEMSQRFALQQYGQEALTAARDWGAEQAQADPSFSPRFGAQPDPVGWLVSQHKQAELISRVGSDPDAWVRQRALELGLIEQPADPANPAPQQAQSVAPKPAPAPVAPPRSLAAVSSAGGPQAEVVTTGIGAMFRP